MISTLNIIFIKIILLKKKKKFDTFKLKNLNIINTNKNNFLPYHLTKNSHIDFKNINYFLKKRPFLNFFNNYWISSQSINLLFILFISYFLKIKNKIIFFYNFSTNFLYKSKYNFYSSLNNFFSHNQLKFYKDFDNVFKKDFRSANPNHFYVLKKKEEFINPRYFLNYNNVFKGLKTFKNIKLSIKNFKNISFEVFFFKKFFFEKTRLNISSFNRLINYKGSDITLYVYSKSAFLNKFYKIKKNKKIYDYSKYIKNKNISPDLEDFFSNFINIFKKRVDLNSNKMRNFYKFGYKNQLFRYKLVIFPSSIFFNNKKLIHNLIKYKNLNNGILINKFIKISELACLNMIFINDFYNYDIFPKKNYFFLFNNFFLKSFNNVESFIKINNKQSNFNFFNNYYPILHFDKSAVRFLSKIKSNINVSYLSYFSFYIINFLEYFFKKSFFLKITDNKFNKAKCFSVLINIYNDYKNYQPKYMKRFLIIDFLEIFWYSLALRDLNIISEWICKFLENIHFRFHRKFILFFQNFFYKYEGSFSDYLGIKGFFFDIRGKVGVAGNSKKRHFFFKTGVLGKSTKKSKMAFKQSVARTPSGALGLTFLINY